MFFLLFCKHGCLFKHVFVLWSILFCNMLVIRSNHILMRYNFNYWIIWLSYLLFNSDVLFYIKKNLLQIRVLVSDSGIPKKTDTTVVTVNVDRNLNSPHMTQDEWKVNILETQNLGVPFIQVAATDDDQKVRCFFRDYFQVNQGRKLSISEVYYIVVTYVWFLHQDVVLGNSCVFFKIYY